MRVCTLGGWNVNLNRVSHAISHHPMPNTEWDLEILGHEPWCDAFHTCVVKQHSDRIRPPTRLFNMVNRPANSKLIFFYGPLLCCAGHLLDVIFTWVRIIRGKQTFEFEMLTNIVQLCLLCVGRGVISGCIWFCIMFLVFGFIDSYAGYPLHHTEAAWYDIYHSYCRIKMIMIFSLVGPRVTKCTSANETSQSTSSRVQSTTTLARCPVGNQFCAMSLCQIIACTIVFQLSIVRGSILSVRVSQMLFPLIAHA